MDRCAWCGSPISDDQEVFALGAKAAPGIDLAASRGKTIEFHCVSAGRDIPAVVVVEGSDAHKDRWDMVMTLCSEACGTALKAALIKDGVIPRSR